KYENEVGLYKNLNKDYEVMKNNFKNKINLIYKYQLDLFKMKAEDEYNFLSLIIKNKIINIIKYENNRDGFWDELGTDLINITNYSISIFEKISMENDYIIMHEKSSMDNDYEMYLKENIKEIRNDSFNKLIKLIKKEITNKDYDIESYLVSQFEDNNCSLQKIFRLLKNKEDIMNESIEDSQKIIKLLSRTKFSQEIFKNVDKDIKIINDYKILDEDKVKRIMDNYKQRISDIYDQFNNIIRKSLYIGIIGAISFAVIYREKKSFRI
ncbi:hypothetical protein PIROE2DRAFT_60821, partial [Piromyces sp. E2]